MQSFQPKLLKEGRAFIHREERAGRRPVFRVKSAKAVRVGPQGGGSRVPAAAGLPWGRQGGGCIVRVSEGRRWTQAHELSVQCGAPP